MGETSAFLLLTLVSTVLVSVCLWRTRSVPSALGMARGFYFLAVLLSLAALVLILLGVAGIVPQNAHYGRWLRLLIYRGWLVIGVSISSAILILLSLLPGRRSDMVSDAARTFVTSPHVLKGICFSVSLAFLCTEIGKLAHDADMRQFFLQSGYPVWFLYFVMAAETAGAIGLFLPRTMLPAALGLAILMMGAIRTHAHNGDSFSDSLEALHLLILLACLVVLRLGSVRGTASAEPVHQRG